MKYGTRMNRFFALICVIVLLVTNGFVQMPEVAAGTETVQPPTFPEITFSDIASGNSIVNDGTYGYKLNSAGTEATFSINGTYSEGFANKTFVGTVNFSKQVSTFIAFGGKSDGWGGVRLQVDNNGFCFVSSSKANNFNFESVTIDPNEVDVPIEKSVEIKLSFEVTNLDGDTDGADDVRFWLYVGGKLYKNAPIATATECAGNLGTRFAIYSTKETSSVTIASKAVAGPTFPEITFSDITSGGASVNDGTYGYKLNSAGTEATFSINGTYSEGFANKTFVGTVNFTKQASTFIAFGGKSDGWGGVRLQTKNDGLYFVSSSKANNFNFQDVKLDTNAVDVPIGKSVEIKLSFEVTNLDGDTDGADDVRFWLYVGGKLYKNAPIATATECAGNLGTRFAVYSTAETSSVTIASKVIAEPIFPEITFSDITSGGTSVKDGTYRYKLNSAGAEATFSINGTYSEGFANKTFVGTVNFTQDAGTFIAFGGKNNGWGGVRLQTKNDGLYFMSSSKANNFNFEDVKLDTNAVDVPIGKSVEIKLSFEVTNLDGDTDGADDVRFWLYVGGKLYKNAPIATATECAGNLGIHFAIYPAKEASSLTIASKKDAYLAGNSVTLDGAIGVNYYMHLSDKLAADTSKVAMHFTLPNSSEPMVVNECQYSDTQKAYVFTCKIPAKHMADEIVAQLYVDGVVCGDEYTVSVKEYGNQLLNDNTQLDAIKTLVKNMLHYGAYSQVYFNYNTNTLANEGLDALDLSSVSQNDFEKAIKTEEAGFGKIVASNLNLKSEISLNVYMELVDEVKENVADYQFLYNDTVLETDEYKGLLVVKIPNIAAHDLDTVFSIKAIKTGASENSATFTYSVFSYAYKALDPNYTGKAGLKDLMKAMYMYNKAANFVLSSGNGSSDEALSLVDFIVEVPSQEEPVILQISDTQIIDPTQEREPERLGAAYEAYWATDKIDERLYDSLEETIEATQPDLILLTGDLVYGEFDDNGTMFKSLVAKMESFEIPWAPVFGNHETESAIGVDEQCRILTEETEWCLFEQRTLTGNGNYTVGIKQSGKLKRVFFMMDSNGSSHMHQNSKVNNHYKTSAGFAQDQMDWSINLAQEIKRLSADTKLSYAFHIPIAAFADAYSQYGFTNESISIDLVDINIDKISNKKDSDFGYLGKYFIPWDAENVFFERMKAVGVDSIFVGHEHCNSASVVYDGIRFQFGQKTGSYDKINYVADDGTVSAAYCGTGTPLSGGTAMVMNEDGSFENAYIYLCGDAQEKLNGTN